MATHARAIATIFASLVGPVDEATRGGTPLGHALVEHLAPTQTFTIAAVLVVASVVLRRYARTQRARLARGAKFLCVSVFIAAASAAFQLAGAPEWAERADALAATVRVFTAIAIVWPVVFELAFARISFDVPGIAQELTAGVCYAAASVELFHRLGFNLWSIVATSAVATAVLGLSLQPTLGNLLGGITLQLDGSVREGDWVRLPEAKDGAIEGKVCEIRWRYTVVETRSGDSTIVPNSALMQQQFVVLGRRAGAIHPHRIELPFDVGLRVPPGDVLEAVTTALRAAPIANVAQEPAPDCVCIALGGDRSPGVARYGARYWLTDLAADGPANSAVLARVHAALERAGLDLGVPGREVSVTRKGARYAQKWLASENSRRAALLGDVGLFAALKPEERASLAPRLKPAPFAAGEIITRQGAQAHWLYVLVRGSVEVFVHAREGDDRPVGVLSAPGFFGEMSLMTGEPRASTVIATTAVECLRLDRNDFRELLAGRPELAAAISRVLAERRIELENARDGAPQHRTEARVADEGSRILSRIREFFGLVS